MRSDVYTDRREQEEHAKMEFARALHDTLSVNEHDEHGEYEFTKMAVAMRNDVLYLLGLVYEDREGVEHILGVIEQTIRGSNLDTTDALNLYHTILEDIVEYYGTHIVLDTKMDPEHTEDLFYTTLKTYVEEGNRYVTQYIEQEIDETQLVYRLASAFHLNVIPATQGNVEYMNEAIGDIYDIISAISDDTTLSVGKIHARIMEQVIASLYTTEERVQQ